MKQATIDRVLAPVGPEENRRREEKVRSRFRSTARRAARQLPFMDEVVAGYFCALDERTPTRVRGILLAALAYFVLPFDAIPDFILGLGFTDDAAVIGAAITAIRGHITPAHRSAAKAFLDQDD
jgi:uncharacterized membrane protein YkvA (DUF1232 family)